MKSQVEERGPLKFPPLSGRAARLALMGLNGHATAANWLPANSGWPELDDMRERHLRQRSQLAAELDALSGLNESFAQEDRDYDERLRQAHRDGNPASVEDGRTPADQRGSQREAILARIEAAVVVMEEVVKDVKQLFQRNEDRWLADLRGRYTLAQDKRREAERVLAEAHADEHRLSRWGSWIQRVADDLGFAHQPFPAIGAAPPRSDATVARDSLERPWFRRRDWNVTEKEPVA